MQGSLVEILGFAARRSGRRHSRDNWLLVARDLVFMRCLCCLLLFAVCAAEEQAQSLTPLAPLVAPQPVWQAGDPINVNVDYDGSPYDTAGVLRKGNSFAWQSRPMV